MVKIGHTSVRVFWPPMFFDGKIKIRIGHIKQKSYYMHVLKSSWKNIEKPRNLSKVIETNTEIWPILTIIKGYFGHN